MFRQNPALNVFDAALDRIRQLFAATPNYIVCFSGGKDSTSLMMLSLMVARELNRLPLEVAFIDEEIIDPDTIAYASQVQQWTDIALRWFCVPIRHTLRSEKRTHWYTWDPKEQAVWARDLPPHAITDVGPLTDLSSYDNVVEQYYHAQYGNYDFMVTAGIRMQEAFNRRRQFIGAGDYVVQQGRHLYGKPIYDWTTNDVWRAIIKYQWPHSTFYDKLWMKGWALHLQRVAPWGNVAQSQLIYYPEFYPEFWERAIRRLPELKPAQRYRMSKIYREVMNKPAGFTWQEYAMQLLSRLEPDSKEFWTKQISNQLKRFARKSTQPFPEEDGFHPSWKKFCFLMGKNDRIHGGCRDSL